MSNNNKTNSVIPTMMIKDAKKAIEFYKDIFSAKETYRLEYHNKIMHAELSIGNITIMISEEMPGPSNHQHNTANCQPKMGLYIYVDDVDKVFKHAVKSGAKVYYPVKDQFYGDRMGTIIDPYGIPWNIATHLKDVSNEEIVKLMPEVMKQMNQTGAGEDYKKKYLKYKEKYYRLKRTLSLR